MHRTIFGKKLDNLDFAKTAKAKYGIDAVEYVNQFFKDKAKDEKYLAELKKRADDHGVKSVLIMCDGEGNLGDPDETKRTTGRREPLQVGRGGQVPRLPLDPRQRRQHRQLRRAAEAGRRRPARSCPSSATRTDINVIVENHGGLSSQRRVAGRRR